MIACYILAGLVGFSFLLSEVVVISSGRLTIMANSAFAGSSFSLLGFLVSQVTLVMFHAIGALSLVIVAESIKLGLDIQSNTQETAHFSKQQFYRNAG